MAIFCWAAKHSLRDTSSIMQLQGGTKGVGPSTTLAWPGWKQPDIPLEVDRARLETSRFKNGFAKCVLL